MDASLVVQGRAVPAENGWTWIASAWMLFMRSPLMWIVLTVVMTLILIVLAFIPVLGSLAGFVLTPVFMASFLAGCRVLEEGGELEIGHLFAGFRERFGPLVTVGLIYLGATVLIALVAGLATGAKIFALLSGTQGDPGALLEAALSILLAALIMLALMVPVFMALWFAPALVLFHQQGAVQAMKASFAACLKNIVPFLIYGVILLGLSILASIPFGLGWLVLGPVMLASVYTAYRDIFLAA
jgi:hypothetical protein